MTRQAALQLQLDNTRLASESNARICLCREEPLIIQGWPILLISFKCIFRVYSRGETYYPAMVVKLHCNPEDQRGPAPVQVRA